MCVCACSNHQSSCCKTTLEESRSSVVPSLRDAAARVSFSKEAQDTLAAA